MGRGADMRVAESKAGDVELAQRAARIWSGAEPATLASGASAVAKELDGVSPRKLAELAALDDSLRRAIAKTLEPTEIVRPTDNVDRPRITHALATKLRMSEALITKALAAEDSPVRAELEAKIRDVEARHGNNDGKLSPADLAGADVVTRRVMSAVYRVITERARPGATPRGWDATQSGFTMPLEQIRRELPEAVGALLGTLRPDKGALGALYLDAVADAVRWIADRYFEEVLSGKSSPTEFAVQLGLHRKGAWQNLVKLFPGWFPDRSEVPEAWRLEALAEEHGKTSGDEYRRNFYRRAGMEPDLVRLLEVALPKKFAPLEDRNLHRRSAELTGGQIDALSRAWKKEVVEGGKTQHQFLTDHGIAYRILARLREAPGDKFPDPERKSSKEDLAIFVAKMAKDMIAKDCLAEREDVIDAFNADEKLLREHGEMTIIRYNNLRQLGVAEYPRFRDQERSMEALAKEIRAIHKERGVIPPEDLVALMKKNHPRFEERWYYRVAKRYPDIDKQRKEVTRSKFRGIDRESDAGLLAKHLKANEGMTVSDAGRRLGVEHAQFNPVYAANLVADFPLIFADRAKKRVREEGRTSLAMLELFELLNKVAPPGTSVEDIGRVMNDLVVERGGAAGTPVDTYTKYRNRVISEVFEQPEKRSAKLFSEIFAEYSGRHPKENADQIVERVRADYPRLTPWRLGRYSAIWKREPKEHPLLPVLFGGDAAAQKTAQKYYGGWKPASALLDNISKDEKAKLARATQYARIPLSLPLVDELLAKVGAEKTRPLIHHNVLWVTHMLGSSYAMARGLVRAGMRIPGAIVVGTPYGTNEAVRKTFEHDGFDVRVPKLSTADYRATVKKALDDLLKKPGPIVVMDDGGLVAEILHSPEYAKLDRAITIVEQTTAGIRKAEDENLRYPVISVARGEVKKAESSQIGRAVTGKVCQGLERFGKSIAGSKVAVMSGGWTGTAIADMLRGMGAEVVVYDTNEDRQRAANPGKDKIPGRAAFLKQADIVIGATGTQSLKMEDLRLLKNGAVVLSSSSKRVEIDMEGLEREAKSKTLLEYDNPLVRLPTARYNLAGKNIVVLGDGWPVNFDGDVEDLPAEEIQITRAGMLAGALQAASLNPRIRDNQRVIPFDHAIDEWLVKRHQKMLEGRPQQPIGDPDRWPEVLEDLARRFVE